MMNDLYVTCGAPVKKLARFPGGSHNETWTIQNYYQTINYFLDEVLYLHLVSGRPRVESPTSLVHHNNVLNVWASYFRIEINFTRLIWAIVKIEENQLSLGFEISMIWVFRSLKISYKELEFGSSRQWYNPLFPKKK